MPGPCWGNKQSQCTEWLLTSVQPVRCRRDIDDVGSTADIAASTSSRTPGHESEHVIENRQIR
jgi:hypothetical protein